MFYVNLIFLGFESDNQIISSISFELVCPHKSGTVEMGVIWKQPARPNLVTKGGDPTLRPC